MKLNSRHATRFVVLISLMLTLIIASSRVRADTGTCSGATTTVPFTDVQGSIFFCQIAEAYFSGLTNGTTQTTYSPGANVTRDQMSAFITRTLDQSLRRGSPRAAAKKWWLPQNAFGAVWPSVFSPQLAEFDGADVWVASQSTSSVVRVRASDSKVLDTWNGATSVFGVVPALGLIFATGETSPGNLYLMNPAQSGGTAGTLTSSLGNSPRGIAFDGSRIWTANFSGSVSIVTLDPTTVQTVSTGFHSPNGILYDGSNIWVTDVDGHSLLKLNANGSIAHTINVGDVPTFPVFDGTNIWVPNAGSASLTVVRVKDSLGNPLATPFVLATLTGNGLNAPASAAFDGERILVANFFGSSVSLWKAADLTPLGSLPTGTNSRPFGACSDGVNFWIALQNTNQLARF